MRQSSRLLSLSLSLALIPLAPTPAQEPVPHNQDAPPGPALSPAEAIAKMTVPEGFVVELVASEPDLVNPVAMTFDEKGRVWVTESLEYPRREPGPGRDRVKVLEDKDGDGTTESVTIFADGLNIPSGIAVGHGGVWVANAPDLLFYPDADRDAVPDGPPQVVATGFGRDDTHELPSALTWGPDGWLYGWNGVFNPSKVTAADGTIHEFTCAIWRVHPRSRKFQVWSQGTSNPWGIAVNGEGEMFASACVIDHLWHMAESAYYIRQGGPYPPFTWPADSIVDYTHQKAAYCGIVWLDTDAYPDAYNRKLYMGNIHGNCINVDGLEANGSTYKGTKQPDFLSANDTWFMPVSQKVGPDGCLYILDWYDRYHCYQDANRDPAGIDRLKGRLYRVRYTGGERNPKRRLATDFSSLSDADLIERLGVRNVYARETARLLLTERLLDGNAAPDTIDRLHEAALGDFEIVAHHNHGLWALISADKLDPSRHLEQLSHGNKVRRAWAVRAAGDLPDPPAELRDKVLSLSADQAPEVRLQVAIAAGKIGGDRRGSILAAILHASGSDPLIPSVVWQNLLPAFDTSADSFLETLEASQAADNDGLEALLPRFVDRLLAAESPRPETLTRLVAWLAKDAAANRDALRAIVAELTDKVIDGTIGPEDVARIKPAIGPPLESLMHGLDSTNPDQFRLVADLMLLTLSWTPPTEVNAFSKAIVGGFVTGQQQLDEDQRVRALATLIKLGSSDFIIPAIELVLVDEFHASRNLRGRLIGALGPFDRPEVPTTLLNLYERLEPSLRPRVIELLTERAEWATTLLDSVEAKAIPASAFNINQLRRLQNGRDPKLAERSRALFGTVRDGRNEQRELVVSQMRKYLRETPGDPFAGRAVYDRVCAQCHKIYGQGQEVGPELTGTGRNDFDQLISNVFDPSLVIGDAYRAVTVATADGRVLTGLLAEDSPQQITLKVQGGKLEVIPRDQVEESKIAEVSLMPEDLEKQINPQELADLFAFLALDKPPGDPEAKLLPGAPEPKPRATETFR